MFLFFFKQKTAYEMRISDWSSDVCSSDLLDLNAGADGDPHVRRRRRAADRDVFLKMAGLERAGRHRHRLTCHVRVLDRAGRVGARNRRSEERREGEEGVSTGRSRWVRAC